MEMIESARSFGYRGFYGDAIRLDLLRIAGAANAKILVVAVGDIEQSIKIVDMAKEHFAQLQIVARARDVTHWDQLRDRGLMRVKRELFESSWRSARRVLQLLGHPPDEARQSAMRFRQHNLALFDQLYPTTKTAPKLLPSPSKAAPVWKSKWPRSADNSPKNGRQAGMTRFKALLQLEFEAALFSGVIWPLSQ